MHFDTTMMQTFVFGEWLKTIRKERRLSRQALADASGGRISQQYIHFIETGRATNIGSAKLQALAEALDLPVSFLQEIISTNTLPELPVVASAVGGRVISSRVAAFDRIVKPLEFPETIQPGPDVFAVEVTGDSMAPRIAHGDVIIVRRLKESDSLPVGHIYLVREHGRLTCKYLMPSEDGGYILSAEQSELFPDTGLAPEHEIVGRILEVRKTHSLIRPIL